MSMTLEDALERAEATTRELVRGDAARCADVYEPFFKAVEGHLRTYPVDGRKLRRLLAAGHGEPPSAADVRLYVEALQVTTLLQAFHLAGGRIPLGRLAATFGIESFQTFQRLCRRTTGQGPPRWERPPRLEARFDVLTWHLAVLGKLTPDDARVLARRLRGLCPEAFEDGGPAAVELVPDAFPGPKPWRLGNLPEKDLQALRKSAAEGPRDRLLRAAEGLRTQHRSLLQHVAESFHLDDVDVTTVQTAVGTHDNSVSSKVRFLVGEPLMKLVERLRIEMALTLLPDRRLSVERIAEAVGMGFEGFRKACKRCTGFAPADFVDTLRKTSGHPACDLWIRAGSGGLATGEARLLAGYLRAVRDDALAPAPRTRREPAPAVPLLDEARALPGRLAAVPPPKPSPPRFVTLPPPEKRRLKRFAHALSRTTQRDVVGRRETECLIAVSEWAPLLYRLREIQCAVTAGLALEHGESPRSELWAAYLNAHTQLDESLDVLIEDWLRIDLQLVDAPDALRIWEKADRDRRRLLRLSKRRRDTALARESRSLGEGYLLARACLLTEERDRRGRDEKKLHLAEAEMAVAVARALPDHWQLAKRTVPAILTDLIALAEARLANVYRMYGEIRMRALPAIQRALAVREEARLGTYVEAEVSILYASVLADEGFRLDEAERLVGRAVDKFAEFDEHLAAQATIVKATVERLQSKEGYTDTLRAAIRDLDARRDPHVVEGAWNKHLYYLVKEGKLEEALMRRKILPWPTLPVHRAGRAEIEGCIDLGLKKYATSTELQTSAIEQFTELGRPSDAEMPLLYRAYGYSEQGEAAKTRADLEAAACIAEAGGFAEAVALRKLLREMDEVSDLSEQILRIAFEAGGCLGPRKASK